MRVLSPSPTRSARLAPAQQRAATKWQFSRLAMHLVLLVLSASFVAPLLLILSGSLTDEKTLEQAGFSFIPAKFSLLAYQYILGDPSQIVQAYAVSIFVTVVGSTLSLLVMALLAYTLSRRDYALRHSLSFYVFFTMLFNGGVVPFYILITQFLHLQDNLLALILPYLVSPWYVLLLRTYFSSLPRDFIDAAKLEGAGEWRIFFQVVMPLSTPALATVGLFSMLVYWNDWWLGLLFINNPHLVPVQLFLYRILSAANSSFLAANAQMGGIILPIQSVRMAMAVLVIVPIAFAFVFVQRYFTRGLTLGSLKGE